jgi:hypothetical protein
MHGRSHQGAAPFVFEGFTPWWVSPAMGGQGSVQLRLLQRQVFLIHTVAAHSQFTQLLADWPLRSRNMSARRHASPYSGHTPSSGYVTQQWPHIQWRSLHSSSGHGSSAGHTGLEPRRSLKPMAKTGTQRLLLSQRAGGSAQRQRVAPQRPSPVHSSSSGRAESQCAAIISCTVRCIRSPSSRIELRVSSVAVAVGRTSQGREMSEAELWGTEVPE